MALEALKALIERQKDAEAQVKILDRIIDDGDDPDFARLCLPRRDASSLESTVATAAMTIAEAINELTRVVYEKGVE